MGLFDNLNTRILKTHIRDLAYVATEQKRTLTEDERQFINEVGRNNGLSQSDVYAVLANKDWIRHAIPSAISTKLILIAALCKISFLQSKSKIDSKIKIIEGIADSYGFKKEIIGDFYHSFADPINYKENHKLDLEKYLKDDQHN